MTTAGTKLLTAGDLLRLYGEGVRGELVRGVLCETMPAGHEHGRVVMNLGLLLGAWVKPRRLGTLVASDAGFWLERDPDTVREPDLAFTSAERLPLDARIEGYSEAVPDLVAEVASPNDGARELRDRALMWLAHGVRLVWVVRPAARTIDAYREGLEAVTLREGDDLDGGDALPGFACPVAEVFAS